MPTRRRALVTIASAATAATAGCTDLLFGDGLEIAASEPSVAQATLDDTGYEHHQTEEQPVEREFEVNGETRSVRATNHHAQYDKAIELPIPGLGRQRAATVSVLSTPQAEVLDRTLNPIDDWDARRIVQEAQQRYEEFGNLEEVGGSEVDLLGETTEVGEFEGEAQLAETSQTVDITLHVAEAVESGDDFVLAVAAYPTQLDGSERDDAFATFRGVEHDG